MKRKLVKQGAATMMISLPSKWIKENKLEKGDEVDLEEISNTITIRATTAGKKHEMLEKYNISNFDPLINRAIISLYIRGSDEIELSFSDSQETKKLKKHVLEELIGFEIINQTQNKILIKDITGIENQDPDLLIKRIFFILESMANELVSAIKNKEDMTPVIENDRGVNKFVHFCLRLLNKIDYKDSKKAKHVYSIVASFEEIGDLYKEIAKYLDDKGKIEKTQVETIVACIELLKIFEELFFKFSREKAKEMANKFESIQKRIENKNFIDFCIASISQRIIRMNNELFVMNFN